jgi:hypothetical protein
MLKMVTLTYPMMKDKGSQKIVSDHDQSKKEGNKGGIQMHSLLEKHPFARHQLSWSVSIHLPSQVSLQGDLK